MSHSLWDISTPTYSAEMCHRLWHILLMTREVDPGDVPLTTSSILTVQPGTSSSPSPGRGFEPPSSRDQQQRTEHDRAERPERQGQQYERRPAGNCE